MRIAEKIAKGERLVISEKKLASHAGLSGRRNGSFLKIAASPGRIVVRASPRTKPTTGEMKIQADSETTRVIMMTTSRPVVAITVAMPAV